MSKTSTCREMVDGIATPGYVIAARVTHRDLACWHAITGLIVEIDEVRRGMLACDLANVMEELGDVEYFVTRLASLHGGELEAGDRFHCVSAVDAHAELHRLQSTASAMWDRFKMPIIRGTGSTSLNRYREAMVILCEQAQDSVKILAAWCNLSLDDLRKLNEEKLVTGPKARFNAGSHKLKTES